MRIKTKGSQRARLLLIKNWLDIKIIARSKRNIKKRAFLILFRYNITIIDKYDVTVELTNTYTKHFPSWKSNIIDATDKIKHSLNMTIVRK